MLHDALPYEQVVDADAAMEFMKEATRLATVTELEDIGERLERKSRIFRELLDREYIGRLDEAGFKRLVGLIFSVRRKGGRLLRRHGLASLRRALEELLYGEDAVGERFDRFVGTVDGLERAMIVSLASETLHFTDPERYWLWTHWVFNPATGTGALPLVTMNHVPLGGSRGGLTVDLAGERPGEVYDKVGEAMAAVDAAGHRSGYSRAGRGLFGTDVFLASVYAVYMYTVFRVKLSQEFNRILPELPELVQRVLGARRLEASSTGETHG